MIVIGAAMAGIWTRDIVSAEQVDLSRGLFAARDPDSGTLFWPHWLAEYGTAVVLVSAGFALIADAAWAEEVALVGLGSLVYTSVNSLGWAFARRERYAYAAPMITGLLVGLVSIVYLLAR